MNSFLSDSAGSGHLVVTEITGFNDEFHHSIRGRFNNGPDIPFHDIPLFPLLSLSVFRYSLLRH